MRSYTLKGTRSFQVQVCLNMYDLFVDTMRQRVNNVAKIRVKAKKKTKYLLLEIKPVSPLMCTEI